MSEDQDNVEYVIPVDNRITGSSPAVLIDVVVNDPPSLQMHLTVEPGTRAAYKHQFRLFLPIEAQEVDKRRGTAGILLNWAKRLGVYESFKLDGSGKHGVRLARTQEDAAAVATIFREAIGSTFTVKITEDANGYLQTRPVYEKTT